MSTTINLNGGSQAIGSDESGNTLNVNGPGSLELTSDANGSTVIGNGADITIDGYFNDGQATIDGGSLTVGHDADYANISVTDGSVNVGWHDAKHVTANLDNSTLFIAHDSYGSVFNFQGRSTVEIGHHVTNLTFNDLGVGDKIVLGGATFNGGQFANQVLTLTENGAAVGELNVTLHHPHGREHFAFGVDPTTGWDYFKLVR
ncbi:MAG TPA: hypothetical protein VJY39_15805 [Acidisphaera sp.]|nr:hypothetical protein [Acidisphaera sp.]